MKNSRTRRPDRKAPTKTNLEYFVNLTCLEPVYLNSCKTHPGKELWFKGIGSISPVRMRKQLTVIARSPQDDEAIYT